MLVLQKKLLAQSKFQVALATVMGILLASPETHSRIREKGSSTKSYANWSKHLAMSLGGTAGLNDTGFTLGGNFQQRLGGSDRRLALGIFGETALTIPQRSMIGGQFFFYPFTQVEYGEPYFGIGPAADFSLGRTNLAFRASLGWMFYLGDYTLTPNIALNFVGNRNRNIFSQNTTFVFLLDFGAIF